MIKIYLDLENDGLFHFQFRDSIFFDECVQCAKKHFFKYDFNSFSYVSKPNITALRCYEELSTIDDIDISIEDKDLLENLLYPPTAEIKHFPFKCNKKLLELHPNMIGRKGFENFQVDAINKILSSNRSILDISCRHGKSYISIMAFGTLYNLKRVDRLFIIARPEGVENYKSELLRFLPYFTENDIAVMNKDNRKVEDNFDKPIILTTYNTFRLSCEQAKKDKKIKAKMPRKSLIDFSVWGEKRMIILDEVQSINKCDSLQTQYINLHRDYFEYRLGLSGTLGFNFLNWFSLAKFMTPDKLQMTYNEWCKYITTDKFHTRVDPEKAIEFKDKVLKDLLITFHDCIPQTENDEQIVRIQMSPKLRQIYMDICNQFIIDNFTNNKPTGQQLLLKFGKLASVVCDPSLRDIKGWKLKDNPKVDVLQSLIEKHKDEKIIVWCTHPKICDDLAVIFEKLNPVVIHGGVKAEDRQVLLNKFKSDKTSKILFANKVISTSITIVEATVNVYFDLPMNSDDYSQSKERIRGMKQTKDVKTYILQFVNSIDEYLYHEIVMKKDKTRRAILDTKNVSMAQMKLLLNPPRNYYVE